MTFVGDTIYPGDRVVCLTSYLILLYLLFWPTVTPLDVLPVCDFKAEYAFPRKIKKYHGVYQVSVF